MPRVALEAGVRHSGDLYALLETPKPMKPRSPEPTATPDCANAA